LTRSSEPRWRRAHRDRIHRREARCLLTRFDLVFRSHAPNRFCDPAFGWKHAAQRQQVALPFPVVCTGVNVQHLSGDMTSFHQVDNGV
jgi:hypothetical protein